MSEEQYWRRPKELELKQFRAWGSDCKKIIEYARMHSIKVSQVDITDDYVRFDVYETFYVDRIYDPRQEQILNEDGEPVTIRKVIISNDPDYKYPGANPHVQIDGNDYYLQSVRTNWLKSRIVVMACLVALKSRFPDVWVDSDTVDDKDMIINSVKFAGKALEQPFKDPYTIFDSLRQNLNEYLRHKVSEDGAKLNDIVEDAKKKGIKFYTDEFQEQVAQQMGYKSIGEQIQEADIGEGFTKRIKVRLLTKKEDNIEIGIGFDEKGQIVGSLIFLPK